MDDPYCKYALAVPDTPKYINQLNKVPIRVRKILGLNWIIVSEDGTITIESSKED
ncbi:hypothetical protein H5P36_20145 [Bacillus sp. APMAM]|nr:hypothetical protein [Bacillus sp. APMAM]